MFVQSLTVPECSAPPRQWCCWANATFCLLSRGTIAHSGRVRPPGRLPTSGRKCLKTAKRRYEEENLTWGDNPKVVIVLLGESRNRSQCSSRSEMMSLAEHNILFALSRRRVTLRARCDSQRLTNEQGNASEGREEAVGRRKSRLGTKISLSLLRRGQSLESEGSPVRGSAARGAKQCSIPKSFT